jgi:hypothetical protein
MTSTAALAAVFYFAAFDYLARLKIKHSGFFGTACWELP